MTNPEPFYLQTLRNHFNAKIDRRKNYSLRSYARYLEIDPASLLGVLQGRRGIPKSKSKKIAEKLNLSPSEIELFSKSNLMRKSTANFEFIPEEKSHILKDDVHFKMISEWEYYAILSLIETKNFQSDPKWIAQRLTISEHKARQCLNHLLELGFIRPHGRTLRAVHKNIATTSDRPSSALRKARQQDLELAMQAIDEIAIHLRDLSSCTMTMNTSDLQDFKEIIRDFIFRFMKKAESKKGNEVYKLSVQLFPLTK